MIKTIALTFYHLQNLRGGRDSQLPVSRQQVLAADLARLVALPGQVLSFTVPAGAGLGKILLEQCTLFGAVRYFYTGETSRLYLNAPLRSRHPWLEVLPLAAASDSVRVNPDGSLACFLPPLPLTRCSPLCLGKFYVTVELIAWLARRIWGFTALRPGQYAIIERLCRGSNTLAILPTGAGKSLCFQLPALLLPGLTLVVSPLKSLMRDQFVNLRQTGIQGADYIDSSKTAAEKAAVISRLQAGKIKLLYLSPERLQIESFQQELAQALATSPISLFAIDEAHCISEWGHDFRPSYLRLRRFITLLRQPPVCALTATASRLVRQDILTLLGLNNQDLITPSTLDRKEISLQVRLLAPEEDYSQELIRQIEIDIPGVLNKSLPDIHRHGAGVVFTPYAAPRGRHTGPLGSEAVSRLLQDRGLDCRHYHAQLPDPRRIEIQDQFKANAFPLLAATKGYGMGIDKANIDYVVHLSAPGSLEAYYQEAGRAGRDGEHAHSVIIARPRCKQCLRTVTGGLPSCSRGWHCVYTGGEKCSYGIQAGLLALEYPSEQEIIADFSRFLARLVDCASGSRRFRYICPWRQSARQQKYLYYLEQLRAVEDYGVLEYRRLADDQFDLLLGVTLAAANSLENSYWLANKVVERIETYKAQKLNMLDTVQLYLQTNTCRRRFLMQYFGDSIQYERCNFCDSDGISRAAAPEAIKAAADEARQALLEAALAEQDLASAIALLAKPESYGSAADITVSAMRELEDRPYNPAALLLAGFFAYQNPETRAYGLRNLQGALEAALTEFPNAARAIFALLPEPELSYILARQNLDRLDAATLNQLAATLEPPAQFPAVHLALLLPLFRQLNQILMEVPNYDRQ